MMAKRFCKAFFILSFLLQIPAFSQQENKSTPPARDTIYEAGNVDQSAEFPGGIGALRLYLSQNIKYPTDAEKSNIQGFVMVAFVVDKMGKVTQIKIKKSVYESLDNEAIRVVSSMPDWKPALREGKTVKQRFVLPINFKLP